MVYVIVYDLATGQPNGFCRADKAPSTEEGTGLGIVAMTREQYTSKVRWGLALFEDFEVKDGSLVAKAGTPPCRDRVDRAGEVMRGHESLPGDKVKTTIYRRDDKGERYKAEEFTNGPSGALEGTYKIWRPDGSLEQEKKLSAGVADGQRKKFHPDGSPAEVAGFRAGEAHGDRVTYHANGRECCRETWDNGKRDGAVAEFHDNGILAKASGFKAGAPIGAEKHWDHAGTLRAERTFQGGKPSGLATIYDEAGRPRSRRFYREDGSTAQLGNPNPRALKAALEGLE